MAGFLEKSKLTEIPSLAQAVMEGMPFDGAGAGADIIPPSKSLSPPPPLDDSAGAVTAF